MAQAPKKPLGQRSAPLTPMNDASIGAGPKPADEPRYGIGKPALSKKPAPAVAAFTAKLIAAGKKRS